MCVCVMCVCISCVCVRVSGVCVCQLFVCVLTPGELVLRRHRSLHQLGLDQLGTQAVCVFGVVLRTHIHTHTHRFSSPVPVGDASPTAVGRLYRRGERGGVWVEVQPL